MSGMKTWTQDAVDGSPRPRVREEARSPAFRTGGCAAAPRAAFWFPQAPKWGRLYGF